MFKKINLPKGVSIVDASGRAHSVSISGDSNWDNSLGYTGVGIKDQPNMVSPYYSIIIGIADNVNGTPYYSDDLSINTKKQWSSALDSVSIPSITIKDINNLYDSFSSKENTDAILAALATSSNPNETDNAAVVARNYSKGCIGKGQWDLPSCGILNIIGSNSYKVKLAASRILGNDSWEGISDQGQVWSSDVRRDTTAWNARIYLTKPNFPENRYYSAFRTGYGYYVIPVHFLGTTNE